MNSQNGAKVDYQDFDERTVDFVKKLKRVFADINIRIAAVEAIKTMADDFERRYGQVALDRIDAGIAPVLAAATGALDQARADLAAIDAAYRENGIERVDAIINPLVAAAQAALVAADQKVAELEAFLAAKQSVAEKGQANGYAGLDAAGKVPAAQLPALTTTATVGAALAGANQEATPADGDRLAGIKAGGSTPFWITFGNLKARLKSYFDGLYPLASSLGNSAYLDVGTTAGTAAAGDDPRFTGAREWTGATISEAEARAGTATTRRAFTAQRVSQAIAAQSIGIDQTWKNVTGSRTIGTSYQNTTGRPIMVNNTIQPSPSGNKQSHLEISDDNSTWIRVDRGQDGVDFSHSSAIVPPGWYYRVDQGAMVLIWAELR